MKAVSKCEARDILLTSGAIYVCQEMYAAFYDGFSDRVDLSAFLTNGCLAIRSGSSLLVHAINDESDIASAVDALKACPEFGDCDGIDILTWDNLPDFLDGDIGSCKFVREWRKYSDEKIRPLTESDREQIVECFSSDPDDSDYNGIGSRIVDELRDIYTNDPEYIYQNTVGFFDGGKLIGVAQAIPFKQIVTGYSGYDGMDVINIFVRRKFRRKGYAKRLLSAVCAGDPGKMYGYSCVAGNKASAATALSCGFKFVGKYIHI